MPKGWIRTTDANGEGVVVTFGAPGVRVYDRLTLMVTDRGLEYVFPSGADNMILSPDRGGSKHFCANGTVVEIRYRTMTPEERAAHSPDAPSEGAAQ